MGGRPGGGRRRNEFEGGREEVGRIITIPTFTKVPGTSSLRARLALREVLGYFPHVPWDSLWADHVSRFINVLYVQNVEALRRHMCASDFCAPFHVCCLLRIRDPDRYCRFAEDQLKNRVADSLLTSWLLLI